MKKKNIISIIIGILIILLGAGIILFVVSDKFPFKSKNMTKEEQIYSIARDEKKKEKDKQKKTDKKSDENKYLYDGKPIVLKETPEEVLEEIKKLGDEATYIGEENGCWKFKSTKESREYEYCKEEGVLHETDFITIGQ